MRLFKFRNICIDPKGINKGQFSALLSLFIAMADLD